MDDKLLLVKAATLLYRESLMDEKSNGSTELVRTVLEGIKLPELSIGVNSERQIIDGLKKTVLEMCENTPDHVYEKTDLLQRFKLNTCEDDNLYRGFEQGIDPEMSESSIKRSVVNIRKSIQNHFREQTVAKTLITAANTFNYKRDTIKSVPEFIALLRAALEPFELNAGAKDPAIVAEINISDESQTSKVFETVKTQETGVSLLKTGWRALNEMTQGGFRRGEEWMLGALQHNNKTGFSLSVFIQMALYNVPAMIDSKKKPMLLRISFEDEIHTNMRFVYEYLVRLETAMGKLKERGLVNSDSLDAENLSTVNPDMLQEAAAELEEHNFFIGEKSETEIASYVNKKLSVNGYEVRMLRVNPSMWTYMHICNKIIELESQGYEVHLCMLDYLAMVPTTGCTASTAGADMRDMYRRVRNFCSPRGTTVFTPHQLSTEAKQLVRDRRDNFLEEIANKGYLDGCKKLDQEIDGEMYIHIFKFKGKSYLGVKRGKHRGMPVLEDEKKEFYLPFPKKGPILCDLWRNNIASRKLGGAPIGSGGEEIPYWDFGKEAA